MRLVQSDTVLYDNFVVILATLKKQVNDFDTTIARALSDFRRDMKKEGAKKETREALITAFWKLYREKSIEKITVGEIAAAAGYNRSTFYEYFYDVPDVLQHIENGIVEDMQFGIPDDDRLPMDEVVATFERNADALSVLLGEHGDFSFFFLIRKRMRDAFAELAEKNSVPLTFELQTEIEYHVAGTTASLLMWLRMTDRPSAETYLSAVRSVNEAGTERLLGRLRGES